MKENLIIFLKKTESDTILGKKLSMLQKQYFDQLAVIANEEGFEITWEDLNESSRILSDDQVQGVSGGYIPAPTGLGYF